MNKILRLTIFLIACLFIREACSQVPDDTDGRLYRLCKTWGYFKYFSQHKCELKWDTLLNTTVTAVLQSSTNAQFNDALMAMFNKVGSNVYPPDPGPDPDTNINFDDSWIGDTVFSLQVRNYLSAFSSTLFSDTSTCLVTYNDYLTSGYTSYIDFRNDLMMMATDYTNEANRLTTMFYYWNVINYFHPYRNLMDQPWDSTLYEMIPHFRQASTTLDFHIAFLELATKINDSHGFTYSSLLTNQFWGGGYLPAVYFTRVDSLCVVTRVGNIPGIAPGDILTELKGIPIHQLEDSLKNYIPASTPAALYRDMYQNMLQGGYGASISLTLLDSNNISHTISAPRNYSASTWYQWSTDPGITEPYFITDCDYGYVNMGMLVSPEVPSMFDAFNYAPAIIFDLRNYPNGTLWDIGPYLFHEPITSAIYYEPALVWPYPAFDFYYLPGWYYIGTDINNLGYWQNPNPYEGTVYILVNEQTQSQAEYTCQYISYHENARVIGTQSAGADGNVSYLTLPGGITTYFTSLGWYYADGYQQQRNGVKIDSVVAPTIAGIRHGTDEILNAALDCLTGIRPVREPSPGMTVFPNPVSSGQVLHILMTLDQDGEAEISILDMTGKTVYHKRHTGKPGENDLEIMCRGITPGVYLLRVESGGTTRTGKVLVY